jgi:hypothetical protein
MMTTNDIFVVHCLVATSPTATWHLESVSVKGGERGGRALFSPNKKQRRTTTDVVVRHLVATCAVVVFIGVVWWWWCRDGNGGFGVCCVVVSGVSWVEGGRGAHPRDYINNDER